ncbi:polyhydroxyalkanoate synthesis regulator phasin [Azospirillum fermentarium]|uniref:hypothetical protein n=1 Tax=Azospirillum fermentarium TaxID=1233114 RepID=UPI002225E38F|nr:hypothetical protein [Azospirillum fermentarium]MCW2245859.1 polyhydroxyalkanoate synthesis regulator phasin [Azospirillum fermentarium]
MPEQNGAAGWAALSICEALLLTLVEKGVLQVEEARSALEDAASAHRILSASETDQSIHKEAENIIEAISGQLEAARPSEKNGD